MIYFLYGEDNYRAKRKLEEIIEGYKKVHKSGLNLIYIDAKEKDFRDMDNSLKVVSMFAEKKLIVTKNIFSASGGPVEGWEKEFMDNIRKIEELKDIVVIFEEKPVDQRTKLFKGLQKVAKCQEFKFLQPAELRKWVLNEFNNNKTKINPDALDLLVNFVGSDLWRMFNEINKLSNYKKIITKEDVKFLVNPDTENDIFKTIDALASKDKKLALTLLHKHLDDGEPPLKLLAMIAYQFKNLLSVKETGKNCGLHPYVFQKTYYMCQNFSMEKLKKIYQRIFQTDLDIKTGKIEPDTALDLLISEID